MTSQPLNSEQLATIKARQHQVLAWAREWLQSRPFLYLLASGDAGAARADMWIQMVVKAALTDEGRNLLTDDIWAEFELHLAHDVYEFRRQAGNTMFDASISYRLLGLKTAGETWRLALLPTNLRVDFSDVTDVQYAQELFGV